MIDRSFLAASSLVFCLAAGPATAEEFTSIGSDFTARVHPVLKAYCLDCHSADDKQGELDLERFASLKDIRRDPAPWQKVAEMLDHKEMPPKDAKQPRAEERKTLRDWVGRYLDAEARSNAGDPGPVPLRRLTNAEYRYTIHDLSGVPIDAGKEFPADGAAGEGFTNAGAAGVMSPALLQKYFDAAKDVASHAVLTPTGIRWSLHTSRRDWTEEALAGIRSLYARDTATSGASQVNLQGIVFETNGGGRLPVELYFEALHAERQSLASKQKTIADVAAARSLNAKYMSTLWNTLNAAPSPDRPSILLDRLREQWRELESDLPAATSKDETAQRQNARLANLVEELARTQRGLFRFATIGHIGKVGGPKAWMEPISPLAARVEIRSPVSNPKSAKAGGDLVVTDAGDGNDGDFVIWERPRLVAPGRPDILLRDLRSVAARLADGREKLLAKAASCLAAADEASRSETPDVSSLSARHGVEPETLNAWLEYLGVSGTAALGELITRQSKSAGGYEFVRGWTGPNALSVMANSSDQHVRIPGNMPPHSVAVHPTPKLQVGIAWKSPTAATVQVSAKVQHAHPECGNGVAWSLEVRRGRSTQRLAGGVTRGATPITAGPFDGNAVRPGDAVCLLIAPRDGNHSCDLTSVDLTIQKGDVEWNLSSDVSPDVLAANPHADRRGNAAVWHFFSEPATASKGQVIPSGSLLARWQTTSNLEERRQLAEQLQKLLDARAADLPSESADRQLFEQIVSFNGPLAGSLIRLLAEKPSSAKTPKDTSTGLDPALFGKHPDGSAIDADSLCVRAPAEVRFYVPAELADGAELVATCSLHPATGAGGSVQVRVNPLANGDDRADRLSIGPAVPAAKTATWTSGQPGSEASHPVLVMADSPARRRFEAAFDDFRQLFPPALCYSKIVPVDEVVTLTLFYREDEPLRRLMLTDEEVARLNALWDELHFVSQDALTEVDAFRQILEFASQDGDPKVFEPLRKPIMDRAEAYRRQLVDSEPSHLAAVVEFAGRAWRRKLEAGDGAQFNGLYRQLRAEALPHEDAIRLMLARVLVAPDFLYRLESAPDAVSSSPVSDHELAARLSYFLWSSAPDAELRKIADEGRLRDPEILKSQARRMLKDQKVRRLATEFACQWLQVYEFDRLDEKSERHFPEFKGLKGDMYEEVIRYFTRLLQKDDSIRSIYSSDHAVVNARLAKFYGFDVSGTELSDARWQDVPATDRFGRGGVLTMAAVLAKQSGASRTSPILRGNWVSEVLLGERLPRPPKDVPPLPDEDSGSELTVRQLIEKHTIDERCAHCHVRIDPFGFTLEEFDAIGRRRNKDQAGNVIQAASRLADGTELDGARGLQKYLMTTREDAVIRQFCRKLLGYALGRSVQLSDEPLLAEMKKRLLENEYHVSVAIEAIVESRQFREIRGDRLASAL